MVDTTQACCHVNSIKSRHGLKGTHWGQHDGLASQRRTGCFFVTPVCNDTYEMLRVKWLGHMVVHANVQAALALIFHGMGCHGQNGQTRKARQGSQPTGGLHAIHHGHLYVHQDHIKAAIWRALQLLDRVLSMLCQTYLGTSVLQEFAGNLLVDRVVLHQQHGHAFQHLRGGSDGTDTGLCSGCQDGLQGVGQHSAGHWFVQNALELQGLQIATNLVCIKGSDQNQCGLWACGSRSDLAGKLDTVHSWHAQIQQYQRIGTCTRIDQLQRSLARFGMVGLQARHGQHVHQQLARNGIVINHQHLARAKMGSPVVWCLSGCSDDLQIDREPKHGALPRLALDHNLTTHGLHKLFTDRQAQASATVFAGG